MAERILRPYDGDEAYVFLSYAHEDWDGAQQLICLLKQKGFRVWWDQGIYDGVVWEALLRTKVTGCHTLVLMLSRRYMDSYWCRWELENAAQSGKNVIAYYLEDVMLDTELEKLLDPRQNVPDYYKMRWATIAERICASPVLAACRGEPEAEWNGFTIDPRINPKRMSGVHAILVIDMMWGLTNAKGEQYTDDLTYAVRKAFEQPEFQDVRELTLDAPNLSQSDLLRAIEPEESMRVVYQNGRMVHLVVKNRRMPEDDASARVDYLNDFTNVMNRVFEALRLNYVTTVHLFYRGPLAPLAFIGQAAGKSFELYYYMFSIDKNFYYRVGAQSSL